MSMPLPSSSGRLMPGLAAEFPAALQASGVLGGRAVRAGRVRGVPENQRHVDVPGAQHAQRLGGSASVSRRSTPGWYSRSSAAAAGTIVPSADGNAASRSRPARSPV